MRGLGLRDGIVAALKADTFSLTAWQVGMYGFMALAYFYFFRTLIGVTLATNTPEFWFMMQLAMLCGFVTSYPVNWWLIQAGLKDVTATGAKFLWENFNRFAQDADSSVVESMETRWTSHLRLVVNYAGALQCVSRQQSLLV